MRDRRPLNFSHSRGLFDPLLARPITVIGAGSVGGYVVANAAKAGFPDITVYDFDHVESHNVPMSIYRQALDVGRLKVEALKDIVREQSAIEITAVPRRYGGEPLRGCVVACVDTIEARRGIWERVRMNANVVAFVDTRIAEKAVNVHMVCPTRPDQVASYAKLFPDTPAAQQTCGRHGFVTVSQIAASAAVEFLTEALAGGTVERHFRAQTGLLWQLITVNGEEMERNNDGGDDDE
jgi:molybdopterin/thiamine biosynthesis adenylyltransferase